MLDVRDFMPEARFMIGDDVDVRPARDASIGDQARVLDVFRMHRPDEVVHAGMILDPAYLATNRSTAFQVNVGGVINLVEAMIAFGVPGSSTSRRSACCRASSTSPIDANHPILSRTPGPAPDFYGSTKVAAEAMLFAYHQALGLDFRTIRPSAVYGLGMNQYVGPIKAMVGTAVRGEPAHFEFGGAHPRRIRTSRTSPDLSSQCSTRRTTPTGSSTAPPAVPMVTTSEVARVRARARPGRRRRDR